MIGSIVFGGKIVRLYSSIVPEKKYAGYDSTNYQSIYKDDIEKFVQTSEIIIGKNIDNIKKEFVGKNLFDIPKLGYAVRVIQTTNGKIISITFIFFLFIMSFLTDRTKKKDEEVKEKEN